MQLDRALAQLSEIHAQVLRSEVFRGYRARPCLLTGALALVAAILQPATARTDFELFAGYWTLAAALCAGIGAADLWLTARARGESWQRIRAVIAQLAPVCTVGLVMPWILLDAGDRAQALLPGIWTTLFGIGLFASLPYLPRTLGWVALFYLGTGILLLLAATPGALSPWLLGVPFAVGQLAAAYVLWTSLERRDGV